MKKLMLILFVLGMALPSFAKLKEKDVIGTWKYRVETGQGDLTGSIKIEKKDGKLVGEVHTDDGETFAFGKVEIQEKEVLYMELDTGSEVLEISLTLKDKNLEGKVGSSSGSFPMTAERIE